LGYNLEGSKKKTAEKLADLLAYHPKAPTAIKLDPWQEEALDGLIQGYHVIVDAPTSAGKTKVVEAYLDQHLNEPGFRACYTCPVKSLSNDKVKDFRIRYGKDSVGISTGDIKENLSAPLVVATLESYRNSLLGVDPDLDRSLGIFDEYHFIRDEGRGSAWEEALILTPPKTQLLLLSASIANPGDFAAWLEKITGRKSILVSVTERPVPLVSLVYFEKDWYLADTLPTQLLKKPFKESPPSLKTVAKALVVLDPMGLTPILVYAGKRLSCVELAQELAQALSPLDAKTSKNLWDELEKSHERWQTLAFMDEPLRELITQYGVAYHHSGLAPGARLGIETLLKEGLLRFCVATMGLSLGINFSVRSALISDQARPGESGMAPYEPSEVLQMNGRAGRRGLDPVGFTLWPCLSFYQKFGDARRTGGFSRLKVDPTTFLGLVGKGFSLGQVEQFYKKSFLKYQKPQVNMNLVTLNRLGKKLGAKNDLPCISPMGEVLAFKKAPTQSLCKTCSYKKKCHDSISGSRDGFLARLHEHLHNIAALDRQETLTPFGSLIRYFPQTGGLLLARMIVDGEIHPQNLLEASELMASFSLARYKDPLTPRDYRFPFDPKKIHDRLKDLYPADLFPDVYDTSRQGEITGWVKEYNPRAGWLVREWLEGRPWDELTQAVVSPFFTVGDVTALFFRVGSFLQSVQAASPLDEPLRREASDLRNVLWRDPIRVLL
jgi:superfamily II RNA helicase